MRSRTALAPPLPPMGPLRGAPPHRSAASRSRDAGREAAHSTRSGGPPASCCLRLSPSWRCAARGQPERVRRWPCSAGSLAAARTPTGPTPSCSPARSPGARPGMSANTSSVHNPDDLKSASLRAVARAPHVSLSSASIQRALRLAPHLGESRLAAVRKDILDAMVKQATLDDGAAASVAQPARASASSCSPLQTRSMSNCWTPPSRPSGFQPPSSPGAPSRRYVSEQGAETHLSNSPAASPPL